MQSYQMLIGGEWTGAESGKTFVTVNPATGEEHARVPLADKRDADKAVEGSPRRVSGLVEAQAVPQRSAMLTKLAGRHPLTRARAGNG